MTDAACFLFPLPPVAKVGFGAEFRKGGKLGRFVKHRRQWENKYCLLKRSYLPRTCNKSWRVLLFLKLIFYVFYTLRP